LAERVLRGLCWPASRVIVVVDNLYAKAQLARVVVNGQRCGLISRLRSNAALSLPPPRRPPGRGRPRGRGASSRRARSTVVAPSGTVLRSVSMANA
jgi:hypothetical protein